MVTNLVTKVATVSKVVAIASKAEATVSKVATVSKAEATVSKVATVSKETIRADISRALTNKAVTASTPSVNRWLRSHRCALCRVPNPWNMMSPSSTPTWRFA